ncbi:MULTISPECIES: TrkH family potassium uptake protein [unclassified Campylobacter]|uniref:TrkH family potassium uptake protein n=1 Tax=unclassified Campylobacter TaxID=2593542 RepID=UPI001237CA81|nr:MULTISPECIES: TrkH family potassium uptake protein [unclassified Campylobacter]KAA6225140.1 potassium transporter [Campylobacter sp. LR196d]KAA6226154.1 potassium transporter [Campylobacter sp. LR185c]KAA6228102.1 potassium transporter [Campylobacter sp. LR286c]KAA6231354.1 potassium transporter [Campylobacter sp. LR264d]KAA6231566.1 potassium transporter [Campylobacter sp. LR291e]
MKQFGLDRRTFKIFLIGYIVIALGGAFLLSFKQTHNGDLDFLDAFFMSTSAVSLSGLLVKNTATDFTLLGQLIILALVQIGGLGYMGIGLFVYILIRKKVGFSGKNLLKESLLYPTMDGLFKFFKKVLLFIVGIEIIGGILLTLRFALDMDFKQALYFGFFHSISAFNNSGFSIFETSLMDYKFDLAINLIITSLVIIGGLGYFVLIEVYFFQRKRLQNISLHTRVVLLATLILILFSTIVTFCFEYSNETSIGSFSLIDKLLNSYFIAVNYRTSGFNMIDISSLKDASLFFGALFMVIGGAPGGTAGGMKLTTLVVLLLYAYWSIREGRVRIFGYEISQEIISKAFVIAIGSAVYIVVCAILLSLMETEYPFIALLFETSSAFATTGLSVGDGGNLSLCATFNDFSKSIIIIMMISGRIGVFAFFLSVFSQDKKGIHLQYPQGRINL